MMREEEEKIQSGVVLFDGLTTGRRIPKAASLWSRPSF
jgi:hypothetical protein